MTLGSTSCESDFGGGNNSQHQNTGKQQKHPKAKYSKELPCRYQTSAKKAVYRQRHRCYHEQIRPSWNAVCHPSSVLSLCYHAGCEEWCTVLIAHHSTVLPRDLADFQSSCNIRHNALQVVGWILSCVYDGIQCGLQDYIYQML